MQAVIMSGGEGTRLRPLTCNLPKPMVPLLGTPCMEHILRLLANAGITDITATTWYLPSMISDRFKDGSELSVRLDYSIETTPLGTAGSVRSISRFPTSTFLVISGDCHTKIDLQEAIHFHKSSGSKATLVLTKVANPVEYGIVITNTVGRVLRFVEKPSWSEVFSDTVNTGIYILEPEIFNGWSPGEAFDFSKDLFPSLMKAEVPVYGYVTDCYWNDIGDLTSYRRSSFDLLHEFSTSSSHLPATMVQVKPGVFIGPNTTLSSDAIVNAPVLIGPNCVIDAGCVLDSYTIIGANCAIGSGSSLKRTILWDNVRIGRNSHCRGAIIANGAVIGDHVNLYEGSVVSADCQMKNGVTLRPDVKIWPSKIVKENSIIHSNLVWSAEQVNPLFVDAGIHGEANYLITPEYASTLAAAFTNILKENGLFVVSTDGGKAAEFVKHSVVAGLLSGGSDVISLPGLTLAEARFAVRFHTAAGGVHIYSDLSTAPTVNVNMEFMNTMGGKIDRRIQKTMEQLLQRGDISRSLAKNIGSYSENYSFHPIYLHYLKAGLKNLKELKDKSLSILVCSNSTTVADLATLYLSQLGCNIELVTTDNPLFQQDQGSYLSSIVKEKHYDAGIQLDETGTGLTLYCNNGESITGDRYLAFASLVTLKSGHKDHLYLPVTIPSTIKNLAERSGSKIVMVKFSTADRMNAMLSASEGVQLPSIQYLMNFDAIAAAGLVLDLLTGRGETLTNLVSELPDFHLKHLEIDCDFDSRGFILRKMIEDAPKSEHEPELFDGVRFSTGSGWTLILPDNDRPILRIYTEGPTEEYANELAADAKERIEQLLTHSGSPSS